MDTVFDSVVVCVCPVCDREIRPKQHAVECSSCCAWIHKGCSGLSNQQFNKLSSHFKKTGTHEWSCDSCKSNEIRRVSSGPTTSGNVIAPTDQNITTFRGSRSRDSAARMSICDKMSDAAGVEGSVALDAPRSVAIIKDQLRHLLKKTNTSNKDVISAISHIVDLLAIQKDDIQASLAELREAQRLSDEKIVSLEAEIAELRSRLPGDNHDGLRQPQQQNNPTDGAFITDPYLELQERNDRAKNIIVFNMEESASRVSSERIDHDKAQIVRLLNKIDIGESTNFKVSRIGRTLGSNRPMKVIFPDPTTAFHCLKQRTKLKALGIDIKNDLTKMQRNHLKGLYKELERRKNEGETNLGIRYRNGVPFIAGLINREKNRPPKNGTPSGRSVTT